MHRFDTRASRARRATLFVGAAAVAACVALASPADAAKKPRAVVTMTPGEVTVYRTGDAPETLPDDVRAAVMAAITGYVNAATVKPLQKGKPASDAALAATMAPPVAARLAGADRAILVDEGLPKSVSKITVRSTPIALTGLADGSGSVVVVTANIATTATTKTKKGKLRITRTGDLVLEPDNGSWKITGYTLTVDRVGKAVPAPAIPTTPAAPGAAPTPDPAAR